MKNIKFVLWMSLLTLSVLWLLADNLVPEPFTYFAFRNLFIQYTGIVGMGVMSLATLLTVRPMVVERPLNGLDKMYRLHKWLGISGLVFAVLHWWWAKGTKWMVGWGWLSKPERRLPSGETLSQFEQLLRDQRGLAESLGEWAFYAAALMIVLVLIKAFPYHWFKKMHKWLAVAYLVLVYHSLILTKPDYWNQPVGWILAILLLAGTLSAVLVLIGRVARKRQAKGVIKSLTTYPGLGVVEGSIQIAQGWSGHQPGQFAFVTSNPGEGAHPYTIASAWHPDEPGLTFIIKEVGDWTNQLKSWLKRGMPVTVEGPYGRFDFDDAQPRQIWVGAGIGITPFIAKMKHRILVPQEQIIDLFHVTSDYDQTAIDKLTADTEAAKVRLHITLPPQQGRLSPEQIRALVPEWRSASLWFCGPSGFGNALREDFIREGLPAKNFHQELFEFR